jgi:hypothetical protein
MGGFFVVSISFHPLKLTRLSIGGHVNGYEKNNHASD